MYSRGKNSPVTILAFLVLVGGCIGGLDDSEYIYKSKDSQKEEAPSSQDGDALSQANETGDEGLDRNVSPYEPGWPELEEAKIRPGVGIYAWNQPSADPSNQHLCTSNFLFNSPDNRTLYLGTASHCGDAQVNDTVEIAGGEATGTLVYQSPGPDWNGSGLEDDSWGNDFALVEIDGEYRHLVHPAMLHYGGPTGLGDTSEVQEGDRVWTYGNATDRPGSTLNPSEGIVAQTQPLLPGGIPGVTTEWVFSVYLLPPGMAGDSGSPLIGETGEAIGIHITKQLVPPGATGFTKLDKALDYMHEHTHLEIQLTTFPLLGSPGEVPPTGSAIIPGSHSVEAAESR